MDANKIVQRLTVLGVSVTQSDGRLDLRPGSRVPPDLRDEVRDHKADLLKLLAGGEPAAHELLRIIKAVRTRGYALLGSNVLGDLIAFVLDEQDVKKIPSMYTIYTVDELSTLFGEQQYSVDELRLIHVAKKYGGRIRPEVWAGDLGSPITRAKRVWPGVCVPRAHVIYPVVLIVPIPP